MEKFLLNKYGGIKINKSNLPKIVEDILGYEDDSQEDKVYNKSDNVIDVSINKVLNEIDNFKSNYGGELSETSILNYKSKIKSINKIVPDIFNLLINNPDNIGLINNIFNKINSKYKNSKDYYSVLSKVINSFPKMRLHVSNEIYDMIQNRLQQESDKAVSLSDANVDNQKLKITWNEFVKGVNKLKKNKAIPLQDIVLFSLYKDLPIRDDFGNIKLVNVDMPNEEVNYYNVITKKFHLNKYKTVRTFGKLVLDLPANINKMIIQLYNNGNIYLYQTRNSKPVGKISDRINRLLTPKYFNKSFGVTDIRKARISYSKQHFKQSEQRNLSQQMLHDIKTATFVYNRPNQ